MKPIDEKENAPAKQSAPCDRSSEGDPIEKAEEARLAGARSDRAEGIAPVIGVRVFTSSTYQGGKMDLMDLLKVAGGIGAAFAAVFAAAHKSPRICLRIAEPTAWVGYIVAACGFVGVLVSAGAKQAAVEAARDAEIAARIGAALSPIQTTCYLFCGIGLALLALALVTVSLARMIIKENERDQTRPVAPNERNNVSPHESDD